MTARSLLVFLLRLGGTMTVLAFPAMLLPPDWMAATHRWLGMGELPEAPVVDYLARSVSALYGFHGVLLFLIATDPARYRPFVVYVGCMNVRPDAAADRSKRRHARLVDGVRGAGPGDAGRRGPLPQPRRWRAGAHRAIS
jgi:hypothetical protein